jgi:hypothetical protein
MMFSVLVGIMFCSVLMVGVDAYVMYNYRISQAKFCNL